MGDPAEQVRVGDDPNYGVLGFFNNHIKCKHIGKIIQTTTMNNELFCPYNV